MQWKTTISLILKSVEKQNNKTVIPLLIFYCMLKKKNYKRHLDQADYIERQLDADAKVYLTNTVNSFWELKNTAMWYLI